MRIVFCDDDSLILQQLPAYVQEFFTGLGGAMPEFAVYDSGEALIKRESRVDIAFLDVEMPGVNGIGVGAALMEQNPSVKIFIVTAYPDYLDEAMRFRVFRYLSKPIDKMRLFRNLQDALYAYNMETKEFPIVTNEGVFIRQAEEIICVETKQRKTLVHTLNADLLSIDGIAYWQQMLTLPCFYVTHRSFIVNMRYVYSIGKDNVCLKCEGKTFSVFLSRRKYPQFKDAYLLYMESTK